MVEGATFLPLRIDNIALVRKVLEEINEIIKQIDRRLFNFEENIREGILEDRYRELTSKLRLLMDMGFINIRPAWERASLLMQYAHALRVRLENRTVTQSMLVKEYRDFKRHTMFILQVIKELEAIVESVANTSQNKV